MALDLGSAQASITLDASDFIKNAQSAGDAMQNLQSRTDSVSNGGFVNWVQANESALNSWGRGLLAFGGIVTAAFAAPIIAGSKAAWGQVDAVEQATIAMNAYADSTEQVDIVLADLIAYARSDLGVLFQREDLFGAAQSMLIYGASIENVTGYVEIMSRSVGLGLSNWDDLNRVIGRVGSTGRLTGNDFDYLTAAGFELDDSLRNTNLTWEELMMHLDAGIPADALAGQADTIRGKTIRLQSALRGLGLAFLGVDSETSKFIEGGLGWQMMRGMERLTDLMKRAAPAVQGFGSVIAAIGRPIGVLFDLMLRLPQPVQTAMLAFTAGTGVMALFSGGLLLMLPRIASTVAAFQALGGMAGVIGGVTKALGALRVAMVAVFMNPLMLGAAAFLGTLLLLYKTNFMGFGDAVDSAGEKLKWFFGLVMDGPDSKNIDISTTFDEGGYTITQTTLPDGTKVWNIIEDETGGTFGEVIESYTDATGTTYILVEPEDDGPAFWAKADLETGKPENIEVPIIGDDGEYQGTITTITSATGHEVTVMINGDGEPVGTVISDIITDPETGTKTMTLELANGTTFVAEVDGVTGSIVSTRDVKLTVDTAQAYEDLDALEQVLWGIATAIALIRENWDAIWGNGDSNYADTVDTDMGPQPTMNPDSGGDSGPAPAVNQDPTIRWAAAGRSGSGIGQMLAGATGAADLLNAALKNLNPEIFRSNDAFNTTASTVPMYTGATQEAEQATGAMASGMGTSFGSMATSAMNNFTTMQNEASGKTASMNSLVSSNASSMQASVLGSMLGMQTGASTQASTMSSTVGLRMNAMALNAGLKLSGMAQTANTQTSNMQSYASSNAQSMASTVGSRLGTMASNAGTKFGNMATEASTSGSQMSTGMTGWMLGAHTAMIMRLGMMVSSVRNAGSSGYDAGYYAGSMISRGFANGMSAYLGQIHAAASAMVAAASRAVIAKAMISSPSRLFEGYGKYIGEGLEVGILKSIPDVGRAADRLLDTGIPSPALNTPIGRGYGGTTVNNYYQQDVKLMTSAEWEAYKQKSDRGNQAYAHLSDPDSHNYGGGV